MPRYLLAPEVAVLFSRVPNLRKRLFIDAQWNTGGRLNEILQLTKEDFVLDDPLTGVPLSSPFVVLHILTSSNGSSKRRRAAAGGAADRSVIRAMLKGMVCDGRPACGGAALVHKE